MTETPVRGSHASGEGRDIMWTIVSIFIFATGVASAPIITTTFDYELALAAPNVTFDSEEECLKSLPRVIIAKGARGVMFVCMPTDK